MFKGCLGFQNDTSQVYINEVVDIDSRKAKVIFYNLEPADYAVSLFHDVNYNSRLDTRFGVAREPVGFSNYPRLFGRPIYKNCRVDIESNIEIDIYLIFLKLY